VQCSRFSIALRSIHYPYTIDTQSIRNRYTIDTQSIRNRYTIDTQSIHSRYAIDTQSKHNRCAAALQSLSNQYTIDTQSIRDRCAVFARSLSSCSDNTTTTTEHILHRTQSTCYTNTLRLQKLPRPQRLKSVEMHNTQQQHNTTHLNRPLYPQPPKVLLQLLRRGFVVQLPNEHDVGRRSDRLAVLSDHGAFFLFAEFCCFFLCLLCLRCVGVVVINRGFMVFIS
jgi:hypothetical protein